MSTELKQGDLVMTEHLTWYRHTASDGTHWGSDLNNRSVSFSKYSPATREQVEAYLKEKGWSGYGLNHFSMWQKGDCQVFFDKRYGWSVIPPSIRPDKFDTSPAQLAEAILMARLLNATKP